MTTEERREYYRKRYQEHAEEIKEKARKRYQEHTEEIKEKARQYYNEHKDQIKARISKYQHENKEKHKEYNRNWTKKNAEREIQRSHDKYHNDPAHRGYCLFYRYKHSDIENNVAPTDLSEYPTLEEVNEMLLQPCVWCGQSDWHKIGLDRKDNRFGHVRGNIQPCCMRCNKKKNKMTNEEFRQAIAEGRIKLKTVKIETCDPAIPAMPSMRSLLA